MKRIVIFGLFLVGSLYSFSAAASVDLNLSVSCSYKSGQFLTKESVKDLENPTPLNWTFNGLLTEDPIFISGGDSGQVMVLAMDEGVIVYVPSSSGTSTFTIWENGDTFWGKQSNVFGQIFSQQFIGSCEN